MTNNIAATLAKPENALRFAESFAAAYVTPAFGARSKSEIDLLVFTALVTAGAIHPQGPIYDLARTLNITPARARNLVLNWQLRCETFRGDLTEPLIETLKRSRFSRDGTLLTFGVESPLLQEEVIARLKHKGFFADRSFSKELVRMPVAFFVEFLEELLPDDTKDAVLQRLVDDKQLPDRSFRALATGVLTKLGEKVAGEVGKEFAASALGSAAEAAKPAADLLGDFLGGLFAGDVNKAVGAAMAGGGGKA